MPSRSYIPTKLADQVAWMNNFQDYCDANAVALGLSPSDITTIDNKIGTFSDAYDVAQNSVTRTPVSIAAQVSAQNDALVTARFYANVINLNPSTSDEARAALQITIRVTTPKTRISAPLTWPVLKMLSMGPLIHKIGYSDSSAPTQKVRARPFGAVSMQLFQSIGATPPVDPVASTFLGNFSRQPVQVELDPADVGKTAYYYSRWVTARGLTGPLVGPLTATVGAAA